MKHVLLCTYLVLGTLFSLSLTARAATSPAGIVVPPDAVVDALPLDNSANVPLTMLLSWEASATATSYNVYFGTTPTPALATNTSMTTFAPTLAAGSVYYFQIGAVNADGETLNDVQTFSTVLNADDGDWDTFRGHARPDVENSDLFVQSSATATVVTDEARAIVDEAGNNAYCFETDGGGNYRWRYDEFGGSEEVTVVTRLALEATSNISHFEFRGLGQRQKIRLNRTNLRFESSTPLVEQEWPTPDFWTDGAMHTLRFTYQTEGGNMRTNVYLDEATTPFATSLSDETTGSSYIEFGHSGGSSYGACLDFFTANVEGAFAPGEGTPIPADLLPTPDAGAPPMAVSMTLPLDGAVDVPGTMPIVWNSVPNATTYRVTLTGGVNGGSTGSQQSFVTADTVFYPVGGLTADLDYSYEVTAINSAGETPGMVNFFSTLEDFDDNGWGVARGFANPAVESPSDMGGSFEDQSNVGASTNTSIDVGDGNRAYLFFSDDSSTGTNFRWRYRPGAGNEVTMVIRIANPDDNSNMAIIDYAGQGYRQKIKISRSNLQFQRSGNVEVDFPGGFFDNGQFQTIRITHEVGDNAARGTAAPALETNVYLNESATPLTTQFSTATDGNNYLDFGRSGGTNYGAAFDFVAANNTGAFAPGEGPALPEDLFNVALPVVWATPLSVETTGKVQYLNWGVSNQLGNDYFTVESSTDNATFEAIGTISADGDRREARAFNFTDERTLTGTTYYRVRQTDFDGAFSLSNTVAVVPTELSDAPSLFPNPATSVLKVSNLPAGGADFQILSANGQLVRSGRLHEGNGTIAVDRLVPGAYVLRTTATATGASHMTRFVRR